VHVDTRFSASAAARTARTSVWLSSFEKKSPSWRPSLVTFHRHLSLKEMPEKRTSAGPKMERARSVRNFEWRGIVDFMDDLSTEGKSSMP